VEKKHIEIGGLKQKQYRSKPVPYVLGLYFPFNTKRVLELIPMAITLGGFGSVKNAIKPSALLLNALFSGLPACSPCVKVTLLVNQKCDAGAGGFTVLITCNFKPERVDSSAYSNVRAVAERKSLPPMNTSPDRLPILTSP
jgi:hypothetical protein